MNTLWVKSKLQQRVPQEYAAGVVVGPIPYKTRCGFSHTLDHLLCRPNKPNRLIESLAVLGVAVYTADKSYSRASSTDGWTRELKISVPAIKEFMPAVPVFNQALQFLSGDRWSVETRDEPVIIGTRRYWADGFKADSVCLFSGGTDSLTGAIDLLEEGKVVALVSHFESGAVANIQKNLFLRLVRHYGKDKVRHIAIQVCSPRTYEGSTRARSFLFIALGLMIASAFGDDTPLHIPENGFVGINIPLTGSRQGSYSTRTTHPAYLGYMRRALQGIGVRHQIINQFSTLSKAEVLKNCKNQALLKELLPQTVSCAKAGWLRWDKKSPKQNCGFCYPCLVRRSALYAIDQDEPGQYAYDAIGLNKVLQSEGIGKDLRAFLQAALRYKKSSRSVLFDVLKTGPLGDIKNVTQAIHPVETGLREFERLIQEKGCIEVKRYLGVLEK